MKNKFLYQHRASIFLCSFHFNKKIDILKKMLKKNDEIFGRKRKIGK